MAHERSASRLAGAAYRPKESANAFRRLRRLVVDGIVLKPFRSHGVEAADTAMIPAFGIVADSSEIEPRLARNILVGHGSVKSVLALIEPGRATAFSAEALSQDTIFGRKNLKCQ